jgi:hypothetical protein
LAGDFCSVLGRSLSRFFGMCRSPRRVGLTWYS